MQDAAITGARVDAPTSSPPGRSGLHALALIALHAALAWPTLYLYSKTADVPAVYLASGVTLAGFMMLAPRGQWLFAAGIFVSQMLGELVVYQSPIAVALVFSASKTFTGYLAAATLRRAIGVTGLPSSVSALAWFGAIACLVVPLLMAVPPHVMRLMYFETEFSAYWRWALLEACGVAIMTPMLLFWFQPRLVKISDVRAEPLLIVFTALLVFLAVFAVPPLDPHQHTPFYAATPVMIWAAARFGCRGAATVNLAFTLVMIGAALASLGPFHDQSDLDLSVIELQLFLMIVTGMTLLLGAYAEARELAQQRRASDKRRLQSLSLRLLRSEERYRNNLATRLHDGIGQTLTLGRMRLDDVLTPPVSPETLAQRITPIQSALDTAIEQVRDMTRDVATGLYRGEDLAATVKEHLSSVFHGMDIEASVDSDTLPELRHETAIVISRSIRECLVNVAKHADAKQVRVDLLVEQQPAQFVAVITDDGVGLDLEQLDLDASGGSSFGLSSVRNSMLALGGRFDVDAEANEGTRVTLTLPLTYRPTA